MLLNLHYQPHDDMNEKKHIVVLTGAGISAESGVVTFRDIGGLWHIYNPMELASINGFRRNREAALDFYNKRRAQLATVEPNHAHKVLAALENDYRVSIITQNVDDLHERAGSTDVLHLHGELSKVTGMNNPNDRRCITTKPLNEPIVIGDKAADGSQMRPFVVMFGEPVPNITRAHNIVEQADVFVVIGTSLTVYPAADLINAVPYNTPCFIIDPNEIDAATDLGFTPFKDTACRGIDRFVELLNEL